MIDIHTHILPDLDDGAADILDSVLMAELAVEGGTRTLIATPHGNIPTDCGKNSCNDMLALISKKRAELESELSKRGVELEILTGMEIYASYDLADKIREGSVLPMPDGKHYMIEFGFDTPGKECTDIIKSVLDIGVKPIIAHLERYECVQKSIRLAAEWNDMGCELQINTESVLGRTEPRICQCAGELLDRDLVFYVASDAHDPYFRTPFLRDTYNLLKEVRNREYAELLLHDNAAMFIGNGI